MSFIINDKKLLNEFIRLAQVAQTAPVPTDPEEVKNIAKKLVEQLKSQLSGDFISEKENANLTTKALENMDTLMYFLSANGISSEGNKIVLPHAPKSGGAMQAGVEGDIEFNQLNDELKKQYVKYPASDNDNFKYYVNKDMLVKYLHKIEDESKNNTPGAQLLRPYIKARLQDITALRWDASTTQPTANTGKNTPTETVKQEKTNNQQVQPAAYVSSNGQLTPSGVEALQNSAVLPLNLTDIDFDRIRKFTTSFKNIANIPRATATANYVLQVLDMIDARYPIGVQSLTNVNFTEIAKQLMDRAHETNASTYIGLLGQLLQGVQNMLLQLNAMLRTYSSPAVADYQKDITDQLENIYRKNIYALRTIQTQMQDAFNALKKGR